MRVCTFCHSSGCQSWTSQRPPR
ncbi:hypothetical protein CIB84_015724 [Bambusicola thoracicus]|uniref:Uncharacterized protein n=1 Tax=Bambusicola thoracicus TaxID=9083 RepID=A0A2P4S8U2_BAMTH|nr:hypothetical protein CIB84_015724 [Bambusicola thoracicus]